MTQVASTVTVPFTANVGGFMGGMKSAMGALQKFQVTTGKTSGSLGKMGAALGVVSAGLAGLKVAQQSVETFKKFESAMTRVQAVSRANNKEMELLSEKTSQVASATTFTATEVAEGMGFMAMAGMEVSTILDSVADAANLAQAAQMGMAEASDIVTNIMKSMGLSATEVTEAVDLLVATQSRANVTVRMLGEGMKYVGPLAKSAGLTLTEVSAAMGNLGNAGIQASMAGTTMRQAIQNMMNPAKRAREAMDELGISFVQSNGKLRPFVDILRDLENASMSTEQILKMFGVRAGPGMAALISQGADSFEKLHDDIQQVGAAADISAAVMDTLAGKENQLAAATENLEKKIGKALTPTMKAMIDDVRRAVEGLANLDSKFFESRIGVAALVVAIGGLVAIAGPVVAALGGMFSAVMTFVGGLSLVQGALIGAGAALATFFGLGDFGFDTQEMEREKDLIEAQAGALKKKAELTKEINDLAARLQSGGNQSGGGEDIQKMDALVEAAKGYSIVIPDIVNETLGLTDAVNEQDEAAKSAAKAVKDLAESTKNAGDNAKEASRKLASMASVFQTKESKSGIAQIQANMFGLGITNDVDSDSVELNQQVSDMMNESKLNDEAFAFADDVNTMSTETKKASTGMRDAANAVEGIGAALAGQNLGSLIGSFFGPLGGAIGGLVDLISQFSPSLVKLVSQLTRILMTLGPVIDPLIDSLIPIVAMIGAAVTALAPALTAIISLVSIIAEVQLAAIVGSLVAAFLLIGSGLSLLIIAIDEMLDFFGQGFMSSAEVRDLEQQIEDNMTVLGNLPALLDPTVDTDLALQGLGQNGEFDMGDWSDTETDVDGLGNAASGAASSLNELTDSVLNAPSGFKLAGYAFDASEGSATSSSVSPSSGGGTTIININEINDPDTVRTMLDEATSRRRYGGGNTPLPF